MIKYSTRKSRTFVELTRVSLPLLPQMRSCVAACIHARIKIKIGYTDMSTVTRSKRQMQPVSNRSYDSVMAARWDTTHFTRPLNTHPTVDTYAYIPICLYTYIPVSIVLKILSPNPRPSLFNFEEGEAVSSGEDFWVRTGRLDKNDRQVRSVHREMTAWCIEIIRFTQVESSPCDRWESLQICSLAWFYVKWISFWFIDIYRNRLS